MGLIKKVFKILLWLILLVLVALAIFSAMNWELVSSMANLKNARTDNVEEWQNPRVGVRGRPDDSTIVMAEKTTLSDATVEQVRNYHLQHDGLSIAIWHNGQVLLEEYSDSMSANSLTASYSMNKSITGLVAATLHAEGALSLDDPVSKVLPEWREDDRGKITLRELLHHSTPLEKVSMANPDFRTMEILAGDDIEKAALGIPLIKGASVFNYATINYQMAGTVIRRYIQNTYQQSYPEYLSEKIWQPIGARDAWLHSGTENGIPRFYAGMQASLRDWLKIGLLIKDKGIWNGIQIIPEEAIEILIAPAPANPLYGLGVWLDAPEDGSREYGPTTTLSVAHKSPYLADDVVFFDGFGGQRVYIVPSNNLIIVRTSQPNFAYDDSVLPNLIMADPAVKATATGS